MFYAVGQVLPKASERTEFPFVASTINNRDKAEKGAI